VHSGAISKARHTVWAEGLEKISSNKWANQEQGRWRKISGPSCPYRRKGRPKAQGEALWTIGVGGRAEAGFLFTPLWGAGVVLEGKSLQNPGRTKRPTVSASVNGPGLLMNYRGPGVLSWEEERRKNPLAIRVPLGNRNASSKGGNDNFGKMPVEKTGDWLVLS